MEARDYVQELMAAGLTQSEIEARAGVPQPTVSKIARGEVSDVFSKTYRALQALHGEVVDAAAPAPDGATKTAAAGV